MLPLLTRAAAREADRHAIEGMGVPGVVLMESAGRGAFEVIAREHAASLERVLLVGGPGQNGGDAWVVARHLARVGHTPRALLVVPDGELGHLAGDARINWHVLAPLGIATTVIAPEQQDVLADALRSATLVVDGVFGTGLARDVSGAWAAVLLAMNAALVPKVALDLPSGVDADTGAVLGTAIHATTTITFGAHKRGLVQRPGRTHAGRVWVADIGVPVGRDAPDHVLEAADLRVLVPPRTPDAHKGSAGHVAIVGGDAGKTGAAFLAGLGALRGGAGLVTLVAPEGGRAVLEHKTVELMTATLPQDQEAAQRLLADKRALVVGPGLGFSPPARALVTELLPRLAPPCVLDADALTLLAESAGGLAELRSAAGPRVLTPHPGEAARLLGVDTASVQAGRYASVEALAARSGQVVVLKGEGTLVAQAGRGLCVCTHGTPAMGTGGTGDVLAGLIGALLASGIPAFEAACAGVLLHALAGERAATGDRGLLASELAHAVPKVLAER